jgi:hypothetical protein
MRKLMLLQLLPRGYSFTSIHQGEKKKPPKEKTPTTDCSPTNCSHLLLASSDTIVQAILTPISKTQEQENQIVAEGENTRVVDMQWTSSLIIHVMTLIRVFVSLLQLVFFSLAMASSSEEGRDIVMMMHTATNNNEWAKVWYSYILHELNSPLFFSTLG